MGWLHAYLANLKSKAADAKVASLNGYASVRGKVSGTSAAKPAAPAKSPPPPPPRRGTNAPTTSKQAPQAAASLRASNSISRGTRPELPLPEQQEDADHIDWANLTPEDKAVFFTWLDEFFARYLSLPIPPQRVGAPVGTKSASPPMPAKKAPPPAATRRPSEAITPLSSTEASEPAMFLPNTPPPPRDLPPRIAPGGPPRINFSTKPASFDVDAPDLRDDNFQLSYPRPTTHGSSALDLGHFVVNAPWSTPWYTAGVPPPSAQGRSDMRWTGSTGMSFKTTTQTGSALFGDLSAVWYTVAFPRSSTDPNDPHIQRSAQYVPPPLPLQCDALIAASKTYGEQVAAFAESYAGTGRYVSRGECWDLAHEALQMLTSRMPAAIPIPSIGRTHGHLIYSGRVGDGRWRGGDDRIRRGDIVEWRSVRINQGMGYAILGDPDHTAVVTRELVPAMPTSDGAHVPPAGVGVLEVVEQSVGMPPKTAEYDMAGMAQGEVWVYRPIGMKAYLGFEWSVEVPNGVRTYSV
ncbi:hypothetical protein FA95DRAFT_1569254 [Auriscalpium vulgare]|uniref:Uncharacterized protein n=1 Tax=Auriscalpium vulgare TaxID=40419 RepID=A0ACB8S7P2_9AGAM|nr:hypothetical protein FA95DRAFT_1569254 [Auriscalpium vulgare]